MVFLKFIKQVLDEFGKDKIGQLSAAFSYMSIFSIGPLLLVLISILGFIFGKQAAQGQLFSRISDAVGSDTANTLQNAMAHTYESKSGAIALVLGIIGLLLGASGISGQLQNSFDAIFNIVPDPKGGIKQTLYVKIKNIAIVILAGLAITVSLVASTIIIGLGSWLQQNLGIPVFAIEVLNNLVSLMAFTVLIYLLYKLVPNAKIPNKVLLPASLAVAFLFLAGNIILGIIIANNATASAYGAAASLITLLLWIYYSGQILFVGAEGVKVYGNNHEIIYEPKNHNLKRTPISLDAKGLRAKLIESFAKGYKNNK